VVKVGKAEKLLQRMRDSQAGWKPNDLDRLYRYYGFKVREGGKHCVFFHPKYPYLMATVKRSNNLGKGYIRDAIDLVDKLIKLEDEEDGH